MKFSQRMSSYVNSMVPRRKKQLQPVSQDLILKLRMPEQLSQRDQNLLRYLLDGRVWTVPEVIRTRDNAMGIDSVSLQLTTTLLCLETTLHSRISFEISDLLLRLYPNPDYPM